MNIVIKHKYTTQLNHAVNTLEYSAESTHEDVVINKNDASDRQINYINAFLNELPENDYFDLDSFHDFQDDKSKTNASFFISELEEIYTSGQSAEVNLKYIAGRDGTTGLFNQNGNYSIDKAVEELKAFKDEHKDGVIYLPIISLRGEDADRVGFRDKEMWQNAINKFMPTFANKMGINLDNLKWYGAFHEKESNPHVHLVVYDKSNKAYLKKNDFDYFKKQLAKDIFQEDMKEFADLFYSKKNQLNKVYEDLHIDTIDDVQLIQTMNKALDLLEEHNGKAVYGYLEYATKREINKIVASFLSNDKEAERLFLESLEASRKYTGVYQSTDSFAKSITNPGKKDKKIIQNNVINYLKNNHELIRETYNNSKLELEKLNVIFSMKGEGSELNKEIRYITNKISDNDLVNLKTEEKELLFKYFEFKNIDKKKLKNNLSDENYIFLEKVYDDSKNNDYFDKIQDSDYKFINSFFGFETREVRKNVLDDIYDKVSKELLNNFNNYSQYFDSFESENYKIDDLNSSEKTIVNDVVKEIFKDNENVESLLNKYVEKRIKIDFLKQEDVKVYDDYYNNNFELLKENFLIGEDNTKIHQFILNSLNAKHREIKEEIVDRHYINIKDWKEQFTNNINNNNINYENKLYSDQNDKYDFVLKTKLVAKALTIAGSNEDEIKNILENVIENNNKDNVFFKDEILKTSLSLLAKEKTIADLKENKLLLSKKEKEWLGVASNISIKNDFESSNYNVLSGIIRIMNNLVDEQGQSNSDFNRNNKNSQKTQYDKLFDMDI